MGLVYSEITLRNPVHTNIQPLKVKCLVDSGVTYLVLPEHIAAQLKLEILQEKEATTARMANHTWCPMAALCAYLLKIGNALWAHL